MEKEKVTTISSVKSIRNDERSLLHKSIERASKELEIFHLSVELAKKSKYTDKNVNFFAEEIFNKYSSSAIQVDTEGSLSMEKSIWVYADKLFDLSKYVEELSAYAITNSVVVFDTTKNNYAAIIRNDVIDLVRECLSIINKSMVSNYEFYLKDIHVRNFNWNSEIKSLSVQLELLIDVK